MEMRIIIIYFYCARRDLAKMLSPDKGQPERHPPDVMDVKDAGSDTTITPTA